MGGVSIIIRIIVCWVYINLILHHLESPVFLEFGSTEWYKISSLQGG